MNITKIITTEVNNYLDNTVEISSGINFSQAKIIHRISLFQNHVYPSGKFDSQGRYKYFYDIISSRVNSEIKNIDFDTKDVRIYGEPKDKLATFLSNMYLSK
jgi:hypothetical protein